MAGNWADILCEWCLVEDAEGEDGLRRVEQVVDGDEGRLLEEVAPCLPGPSTWQCTALHEACDP